MKPVVFLLTIAAIAGVIAFVASPSVRADEVATPVFLTQIPSGYRDWRMIAVNQLLTGAVDQLRAQLGNEITVSAFKEGKLPFPDGAIIAALHWNRVISGDNNKVLAGPFPRRSIFRCRYERECPVYG